MTDQKECPFCGESIKSTAKKCRYCGEFFDGLTREQAARNVTTGGGANIGGNATVTDGDLVGRDKINIDLYGDNRTKQYEAVIAAVSRGTANPAEMVFVGFDLSERSLVAFQLASAQLNNANLENADLRGAKLTGANLVGANLTGANLAGADLTGADLRYACLRYANLRYADLCVANLRYADLTGAKLTGADLSEAVLRVADLSEADLREAVLSYAKYNSKTIWPEGFDAPKAGAIFD